MSARRAWYRKPLDPRPLISSRCALSPAAEAMGVGEPTVSKSGVARGDTVHLDIIDRHGNMVSATPSGGWLQSSPVIPALGFCLGNRGQIGRHPW